MPTAAQTILLVDDDPMLLDLLACTIDCAGYQTVMASDGAEGMRLAREVSPALVLCDMTMPGVSGLEVLRSLRADPLTAEVPLVLMSGDASPNLQGITVDAFLAKPFDLEAVRQLVRALTAPLELSMAN